MDWDHALICKGERGCDGQLGSSEYCVIIREAPFRLIFVFVESMEVYERV